MEEDRSSKFSPSKLGVYKQCPRRYQYRYLDRIARERKTPETVLGTAVHSAFEELYGLVSGGRVPSVQDVQAVFDRAFDAEWDERVQNKDARFTKEDWRKVGRECVALYYRENAPFNADRTVAVEKRVGFPLAVEDREYRIEGFVDRLALASDGAFEVHDYKTSKSLPSQADVDADWQLALYELAVRCEWPDAREVRLKWHFVRHGRTLVSVRDAQARERLRADVAGLISTIKHDHAFEPKSGPLCDWCEYKDLCPVFAHPVKIASLTPEQRGHDEGVRLADAFFEVEGRRRRIKEELKIVEKEKENLETKIADWAVANGVSTVAGHEAEVVVSAKEEIHFPTKSGDPERHAALEAEARRTPLWADVARLDVHALVEGVRSHRWSGEIFAMAESLLERYGTRALSRSARLRRRRDSEED